MQMKNITSSDFDKMIIESIDEVLAFSRENDELLFMFDQIISGEISSESETIYAEGRQGTQLAAFDRNKSAAFTCENGYVQAGAIATQLGTTVDKASGESKIKYDVVEIMEVKKGTTSVELGKVATNTVTGEGDNTVAVPDVKYVYVLTKDGSKKETYSLGTSATGNNFTATYTPETAASGNTPATAAKTTITLPAAITAADNAKIMIQYQAESSVGQEITNSADNFTGTVKLVINFVAQDPCAGNKYLMQCVMPNAKVSGSFTLSAGDSPAVQNFEAAALLDVCSVDRELFTIKMV